MCKNLYKKTWWEAFANCLGKRIASVLRSLKNLSFRSLEVGNQEQAGAIKSEAGIQVKQVLFAVASM